jgi:hypothetical protein
LTGSARSPCGCNGVFACGIFESLRFEVEMNCEMKIKLTNNYETATSLFSEAVLELRRKIGTSSKEEYDRISRLANDARVKSERARLALEEHIAEHRC